MAKAVASAGRPAAHVRKREGSLAKAFRRDWRLYLMLVLPTAFYVIFMYGPMYGVQIAFKDYNIFAGIMNSEWVGFDVFESIFKMPEFYRALRNTLMLNIIGLVVGFPAPILLAVMLNEVHQTRLKKSLQTVLYLPHFMSWVIIGGMVYQLFASKGIVNHVIGMFTGGARVEWLSGKIMWVVTYQLTGVWHSIGWSAIIYLAAITGINSEIYEAARVDGCGRFRMITSITLPCIKSTIVVMLVINLGKVITISFDQPYVLGNPLVEDVSDVISTFVYRVGLQSADYSTATAVGLFQSVVSTILIVLSNQAAKRLGEEGIW